MTTTEPTTPVTEPPRAGVIGVGAMGENHVRVYSESRGVELAGITDLDDELATCVADEYGTTARSLSTLLETCDLVSIAVPTAAHYETVRRCLDEDVHVLVEKPLTARIDRGRELAQLADERGLILQVGHVERFNPAVRTAASLVEDLDIIAIEAQRLGPPIDRTATDRVTLDLMIHDVDVVQSLLDDEPTTISATGTADGQHATATLEYGDVVATMTASRVSQRKVRRLTITAADCLVEIDYLDQSVLLYRDSFPEFVSGEVGTRYRHESVIERPEVNNREPLRVELESFVEAATTGSPPDVTAADGLRALETVREIDRLVTGEADLEVTTQ
ncbi:putative dehydrogenase [Halovivax ruber XH-70]|uniref:Putative dehydrogenase n=1 Tax=Halovivax ruber (strain DSM 18193 / JCM 13892 / XH-70) TaxID=797302 RepID=L0IDB2_HALRX|nr:Gfo/Idh/MocA family oxidoreductase [Halovivax ruber]AGB16216.1 putative dehydrogenase [Halovivax ruber XH-70]